MWYEIGIGVLFFFFFHLAVVPAFFIEKTVLSSTGLFWCYCRMSIDRELVDLLFNSTDLCSYQYHIVLIIIVGLKWQCICSYFVLHLQHNFYYSRSFAFSYNFYSELSHFHTLALSPAWILIEIVLTLFRSIYGKLTS